MRLTLQIVSWLALGATALAPVLFLAGQLSLPNTKLLLLTATIAWFATAPLWMDRPKLEEELVM
jgi:hypothetical protein